MSGRGRVGQAVIPVGIAVLALLNVAESTVRATPTASQVVRDEVVDERPTFLDRAVTDEVRAVAAEPGDSSVVALAPPSLPAGGLPAPGTTSSDSAPDASSSFPSLPSAGAAQAVQAPSFGPVQAVRPRLRIEGVADASLVGAIRAVDGVVTAAAVEVGTVPVMGEEGVHAVTVAAVDPQEFRPLTPQITVDEVAVWERVAAGDAAFTHDAGHRLSEDGVALGAAVPAGRARALRVGAYASNGIPPVADAIVSDETGAAVGLHGRTDILVALADGADIGSVASALAVATGVQPEVIEEPAQHRAFLTGNEAQSFFEPFSYVDHGDGMITIDPAWVSQNIVRARVPVFTGEVVCHRQMVVQLQGALQEVVDLGLDHLIDTTDYGGCWVPRHIDWRADRPISMHAWGLAVDFNVRTNGLGRTPTLDPRIVEVFDRWGFVWGGRWSRPDGMHFELGAVLN